VSVRRATHKTPARGARNGSQLLLSELRELISKTREQTALAVNAGLTLLYWQVGDRIRREILKEKRAKYGAEIVSALSRQLEPEFGRGFGRRNLFRMIRFAEVFPDREIVSALMTQLGWTHFLHIIPLDEPLKRDFYAEMCRIGRWSTRMLQERIQSMLYERTALSKKPDKLIEQELQILRDEDRLTPDLVFRDPYFLDFLGLKDTYSEKDLEASLLREIESFLLELGSGFAFINILKAFNDQFGNIDWKDADKISKVITKEIPAKVAADKAYQNAMKNSDKQNARIEHDIALKKVLVGLLSDYTELFKQFSENPAFQKWLADTVFTATYQPAIRQ
jgi:predicted nuclease of restriction endonuclease-like (RecB) superfamily